MEPTIQVNHVSHIEVELEELKKANEFLTLNLRNIDMFLGDLVAQLDNSGKPKKRWFNVAFFPRKWGEVTSRLKLLVDLANKQKAANASSDEGKDASGN